MQTNKNSITVSLKTGAINGIKKGWHNFLWLAKFLVPISLAVALLQWTGWLYKIDFILNPVMQLLHLPSEAAYPILIGAIINIYSALAIVTVVPFSPAQLTLIVAFVLIAHNLILEGIIQHGSGINAFKMVAIRLIAATIVVLAIAPFMGDTTQSVAGSAFVSNHLTFWQAIGHWALETGKTLLKALGIVIVAFIILESLAILKWDKYLYRFFQPFMKVMGLSDRSAILWVTGALFGLTYGSAVIMEKTRDGTLTRSEMERIHISIGINHSLAEDPLLFMALGANGFWLYIPRLIMVIICVQAYRGIEFMRGRLALARAGSK